MPHRYNMTKTKSRFCFCSGVEKYAGICIEKTCYHAKEVENGYNTIAKYYYKTLKPPIWLDVLVFLRKVIF